MLKITFDIRAFEKALTDLERRQLPFAVAMALNDTAQDASVAEAAALSQHLDRPTPFTKRAYQIERATKSKPYAIVKARPIQAAYLQYQVFGGRRSPKGQALVVPSGAKLNAYGNLPKGAVKRALSQKNTFATKRGGRKAKHLGGGVYQRLRGGGLKKLMAFEPMAKYRVRLPFGQAARRSAESVFAMHFERRFTAALASAR